MQLSRLPDWPERLADTIEAARGRPFSWGSHDCATFASDCALAVVGRDLNGSARGAYASRLGAARYLRSLGCACVADFADLNAGPRMPIVRARRGDWVAEWSDAELGLGVACGAHAVFLSQTGLTLRPTLGCVMAWRIG